MNEVSRISWRADRGTVIALPGRDCKVMGFNPSLNYARIVQALQGRNSWAQQSAFRSSSGNYCALTGLQNRQLRKVDGLKPIALLLRPAGAGSLKY